MPTKELESSIQAVLKKKSDLRDKLKAYFPTKFEKKSPVVGIWFDETKDSTLAASLIEASKALNLPIVLFTSQENAHVPFETREKVCTISTKSKNWQMFYDMCDAVVVLSKEDEHFYKQLWNSGIIPIASDSCKILSDYNPNSESGNSFIFDEKNVWAVFAALIRSAETFKFPYDWKHIIRQAVAK